MGAISYGLHKGFETQPQKALNFDPIEGDSKQVKVPDWLKNI